MEQKGYIVCIQYGEYEDKENKPLAMFTNKEKAERWASSIDTLLHHAIKQAEEKELQDDYSGINYSLFGMKHVQQAIKWGEFSIRNGYSLYVEDLPLLG